MRSIARLIIDVEAFSSLMCLMVLEIALSLLIRVMLEMVMKIHGAMSERLTTSMKVKCLMIAMDFLNCKHLQSRKTIQFQKDIKTQYISTLDPRIVMIQVFK